MAVLTLDFRQRFLLTLLSCSFLCFAPRSLGDAEKPCPCNVCPCYCPCIDRSKINVGFVQYCHDRLWFDDAWAGTGFALARGVRQAARDRGLQLSYYRSSDDNELGTFHRDLLQDGLLDAVVSTGDNTLYLPSLLAAVKRGIPVYIVGNVPRSLLQQLREQAPATAANRQVPATPLAGLVHIGSVMEDVAAAAAQRLISAGMQRLHCINTHEANEAFQEMCHLLVRAFASQGLAGASHLTSCLFAPIAVTLGDISTVLGAHGPSASGNTTALVVMDTVAYALVNRAREVQALLPEAHVVVLETSVDVLADMRAGKAVTALDQPLYSQGYMAVALAAQELVTGQMLTVDVPSTARLLSGGEVTGADVARELCRKEGFPVCGDPGVPNVTASGCACFPRSDVKFHVLATFPPAVELRREVVAGLLDAQRDFAGSSFTWYMGQDADFDGQFAPRAAHAALAEDNWTSLLSLDTELVPIDADLADAMVRIGQVKGNRSYWLGSVRNESRTVGDFLAEFAADGYIGPAPQGWVSLGRAARGDLWGVDRPSVLLYVPLLYLPLWVQTTRYFIDGFFNGSLSVPPGFWDPPLQGNESAGTGVWSLFCDAWREPVMSPTGIFAAAGSVSRTDPCSLPDQASLQVKLSPPALGARLPYVQGLTRLLKIDGSVAGGSYDAVVVAPFLPDDVALTLQTLEKGNATARGGGKTTLFSISCFSNDFQAFAYPDSLPGGARHAGCLDPQFQLGTYIAYMASVLHQQTLGEPLLSLDVSTDRVVTRTSFSQARRREADCRIARRDAPEVETMFPVCDYHAGCGGNETAPPCSGHGTCRFPTAEMNAAEGGSLAPWLGQCVCKKGYGGRFCEAKDPVPRWTRVWLPIALGLFALLLLLALLLCLRLRACWGARGKRQLARVRKMRRPAQGQQVAVVFTDIEGSTVLWEWNPEVMVQALQVHNRLLRALLIKHHGYESNTEGDAFELVFHNASDALHWAMDAQLALLHPENVLEHGNFWAHLSRSSSTPAWPPELLGHPLGAEVRGKDGSILYRGLRVRMGIHVGLPEASFQHPNGRQRYLGKVVTLAKAIGDAPTQGGQVLMSVDAWASLDMASESVPLVPHSMGDHVLGKDLPPLGIMQVIPQPLQGRAPFPPLRSHEQISPSFFEAPASGSYLEGVAPRDPVAIMFTFVCGSKNLKRCSAYPAAVRLVAELVRATLRARRGYECEEKDGNFLLAFGSPLDAVAFSQELQVGAMALPWPQELLLEEEVGAEVLPVKTKSRSAPNLLRPQSLPGLGSNSFYNDGPRSARGLRIKAGICWSRPVRCLPHGSTGRATYFGPIMNRAARIAASAADGETLCNAELVQAVRDMEGAQVGDVTFTSVGEFSLKGIVPPVELFQVSSSRVPSWLVPPRSPSKRRQSASAGTGPASAETVAWSQLKTRQVLSRTSFESNSSSDRMSEVSPVGTEVLSQSHMSRQNALASFPLRGDFTSDSWPEYRPVQAAERPLSPLKQPSQENQRATPAVRRSQSRLGLDSVLSLLEHPLQQLARGGHREISETSPESSDARGISCAGNALEYPSPDAWLCPSVCVAPHEIRPAGDNWSHESSSREGRGTEPRDVDIEMGKASP